jgi:hypothetical protein
MVIHSYHYGQESPHWIYCVFKKKEEISYLVVLKIYKATPN